MQYQMENVEIFYSAFSNNQKNQIKSIKKTGVRGQGSPVKSATLVFFEEFNGASRGQRAWGKRKRGKS
jgi:hypothetical protein